jgi:predicted ATPase
VGVFDFLHRVEKQQLQNYTGEAGGANSILHFGRKKTAKLQLTVEFQVGTNANLYEFELRPTDEDRFIFEKEATYYWNKSEYKNPYIDEVWTGHSEARVTESKKRVARYVRDHLDSYRIYHFHDTSASAPVKQTCDVADNRFLRSDAANLAAFLFWLQEKQPDHFRNIEDTVRQAAPFFNCFKLAPTALNPDKIKLEWEEKGSDTYFSAAALSDGTLRFICLSTLLLQTNLPSLILIDEPELGLHPAAIQVLAGLLQSAATRTQLIVATQSVTLINQLQPEHVWIVDREEGQSVFRHLKEADMSSWFEDYGLGELWEKNILGGRP